MILFSRQKLLTFDAVYSECGQRFEAVTFKRQS